MDIFTLGAIFGGAIIIGILAVLMGGTLFLSFPLFQLLCPQLSAAAIVGTIKVGSVCRNLAALRPIRASIDWSVLWLAPILCLGSVIGSWQIVSFPDYVILIVLVIGWLVQEFGNRLRVSRSLLFVITFVIGVYGGIFGAGIMLLIMGLLALTHQSLGDARASALLLELLVSAVAVVMIWQANLINWPIALVWATGSAIGGYIGGITVKNTIHWSESTQRWLVRGAFLIAFVVATWKLLFGTN